MPLKTSSNPRYPLKRMYPMNALPTSTVESLYPTTILLVAQHSDHFRELQAITASWAIKPRLLWTPLPTQATQLALMHRIDLALLDTELQDAGSNSLERLIARCIPSAQLCTFQERGRPGVSPVVAGQLFWDEMPLILRSWIGQQKNRYTEQANASVYEQVA